MLLWIGRRIIEMEKLLIGLMVLVGAIVALLILGLILLGVDYAGSEDEVFSVEIIETMYSPSTRSTGVGVTSGGNAAVVTTGRSEKFEVLVEYDGGWREIVELTKQSYANVQAGKRYRLVCPVGWISSDKYTCRLA